MSLAADSTYKTHGVRGVERWCIHFSIVVLYIYLYHKRFDSMSQVFGDPQCNIHPFF
jgi:hypothetical protein